MRSAGSRGVSRGSELITLNMIPVRLHVQKHPEAMSRFNVQWTPTVLILDSDGNERHRIEGYLPADEFLVQLNIGMAPRCVSCEQVRQGGAALSRHHGSISEQRSRAGSAVLGGCLEVQGIQ